MSQLLIIGDANPTIGKEISYRVSSVNLGGLSGISINHEPIKWHICVLEHGQWRKTSENSKLGETVIYTFTQSSLSRKGIKLIATRGNEKGEVIIKTKRADEPKILKVELLDVNYNKVTKPLNYMDSLIAKAHCTDMEGEKLYFTLWEDDAPKAGHNLMNQMNRINPIPVPAIVKRGKAEAKFNMASYTMASMIANMHLAKGDRSEGKTHEYYVTADYYGKLQASNNINIRNENSSSPFDFLNPALPASKPKDPNAPNKPSAPPPITPKKGTYKTAVTPKAKTKAPDAKGKIISAEFVDLLGRPYQQMKFGTQVNAKIITKNMKGKTIKMDE